MNTAESGERGPGLGIVAAGIFAIVVGLGEIIVGFTGNSLPFSQNLWSPPLQTGARLVSFPGPQ